MPTQPAVQFNSGIRLFCSLTMETLSQLHQHEHICHIKNWAYAMFIFHSPELKTAYRYG